MPGVRINSSSLSSILLTLVTLLLTASLCVLSAQDDHNEGSHGDHGDEASHQVNSCGGADHHGDFDPGAVAFHHISDQNVYSIGMWSIPLPCILYAPDYGVDFFSSAKFQSDSHGNGKYAYNRYVLYGGQAKRVTSADFPLGKVELEYGAVWSEEEEVDGEKKDVIYVCHNGERIKCDSKSTIDGGLFGGGITSFHDFSLTKNVVSMIIVFIFLTWMFLSVAKAYKARRGMAPKGLQSFIEPIFVFIQDEVAKPFLGRRWQEFLSLLMALFFFILGLNLFGQIPFFGGSNVTGNLSVTMVLAIIAFIVTNIHGNRHYWQHIFWMPGVPTAVKFIITPIEFLGLFIKPATLMLRLFANITAGHMVIIVFVGLIFIFGESGENVGGAAGAIVGSTLLTIFMMAIELLVAFIQAFVFTILTASYIGAAIEEHH